MRSKLLIPLVAAAALLTVGCGGNAGEADGYQGVDMDMSEGAGTVQESDEARYRDAATGAVGTGEGPGATAPLGTDLADTLPRTGVGRDTVR